jgi:hypothetical protein
MCNVDPISRTQSLCSRSSCGQKPFSVGTHRRSTRGCLRGRSTLRNRFYPNHVDDDDSCTVEGILWEKPCYARSLANLRFLRVYRVHALLRQNRRFGSTLPNSKTTSITIRYPKEPSKWQKHLFVGKTRRLLMLVKSVTIYLPPPFYRSGRAFNS